MNFNDIKYVRLVSVFLDRFKDTGNDIYRFRCPFCGDSKAKKNKTRGYFYSKDGSCNFKCHNCGKSISLYNFLKEISPPLAKNYIFDRFGNHKDEVEEPEDKFKEQVKFADRSILDCCTKISDLPSDNKGRSYLEGRLIPQEFFDILYYIENVQDLTSKLNNYKDTKIPENDGIIIPFFNEKKEITHIQIRFLDNPVIRYLTLTLDDNAKKIYGLERVDWNKKVFVCEGPFDSLFLPNCIAVAGVSILSEIKYLREHSKSDLVLIFDKDYRKNAEVYGQFVKAIEMGERVVMFDNQFTSKDINAQVQDGTIKNLPAYLDKRTFSGLGARLELTRFNPPIRKRQDGYQKERKDSTINFI
jgi:transcription elongation factor Elf1